ncbi:MAG: cell division protein FtsB [Xanthomonadaceae bacterium]|nr:cell division protein FtsB [Xanthomonadaceae bacterium]
MRWLIGILAAALLVLQYQLWVADGGAREAWSLHQELRAQQLENERLAERNAALAAEVEDLKSGLAAIEERARADLGMVRDGETFYHVVEPTPVTNEDRDDG